MDFSERREFNLGNASNDFENALSGVIKSLNFGEALKNFDRQINQKMHALKSVEQKFNSTLQKTAKIIADDNQEIEKLGKKIQELNDDITELKRIKKILQEEINIINETKEELLSKFKREAIQAISNELEEEKKKKQAEYEKEFHKSVKDFREKYQSTIEELDSYKAELSFQKQKILKNFLERHGVKVRQLYLEQEKLEKSIQSLKEEQQEILQNYDKTFEIACDKFGIDIEKCKRVAAEEAEKHKYQVNEQLKTKRKELEEKENEFKKITEKMKIKVKKELEEKTEKFNAKLAEFDASLPEFKSYKNRKKEIGDTQANKELMILDVIEDYIQYCKKNSQPTTLIDIMIRTNKIGGNFEAWIKRQRKAMHLL